jgi:hypothetical protein
MRIYEKPEYELMRQDETSHNAAKRYTADVLVNRHYPKALIREIVKSATWELRHSDYHRSDITERRFADQEADVVTLFVYGTETDRRQLRTNWICRTSWINPNLPEQFRPMRFGGEEYVQGLEIDWNVNVDSIREFAENNRLTKSDWLKKTEGISQQVAPLFSEVSTLIQEHEKGHITDDVLDQKFGSLESVAQDLFRLTGEYYPPVECTDCNQSLIEWVSHLHNILVPYATWGQAKWTLQQKKQNVRIYMEHYQKSREVFIFEWRKLTGRQMVSA